MTDWVVFENPGELDLRLVRTFGASVKEGPDPIGLFGTGLKYAIAVLLRLGCRVRAQVGEREHEFAASREVVRGKEFGFVIMHGALGDPPEPLGFTTDLGKFWEPWMAYRELWCNARDEGGPAPRVCTDAPGDLTVEKVAAPPPERGVTRFLVSGAAFLAAHRRRSTFILGRAECGPPAHETEHVEVWPGESDAIFYRGIKVAHRHGGVPSRLTYNIKRAIDLTEDRTAKYGFQLNALVLEAICSCPDAALVRAACSASKDAHLEGKLDFGEAGPTDAFLDAFARVQEDKGVALNVSAVQLWRRKTRRPPGPRPNMQLTGPQRAQLDRAVAFAERLGFPVREYPIVATDALGPGKLGEADHDLRVIYVAERAFEQGGAKQVASVLIEEYVHLAKGLIDCTYGMQNWLFEKLVSLGEELTGEVL